MRDTIASSVALDQQASIVFPNKVAVSAWVN